MDGESLQVVIFGSRVMTSLSKINRIFFQQILSGEKGEKRLPALIKELNREADDFIICNDSLVLVCHLSAVLI